MNKFHTISDAELLKELDERDLYDQIDESNLPNIADETNDELKRELESRGYFIYDSEPELNIETVSDDDILEEFYERQLENNFDEVVWYYQAGKYEDMLIEMERDYPIEFAGISRMRLSHD